jgi:hypothetical protein
MLEMVVQVYFTVVRAPDVGPSSAVMFGRFPSPAEGTTARAAGVLLTAALAH